MSDIKCPFCQHWLKEIYCNGICVGLACKNIDCLETKSTLGNKALWQALIDTKEKLDIAVGFVKKIDGTRSCVKQDLYAHNKSLNSGIVFCWTTPDEIHNTLEQINKKGTTYEPDRRYRIRCN